MPMYLNAATVGQRQVSRRQRIKINSSFGFSCIFNKSYAPKANAIYNGVLMSCN